MPAIRDKARPWTPDVPAACSDWVFASYCELYSLHKQNHLVSSYYLEVLVVVRQVAYMCYQRKAQHQRHLETATKMRALLRFEPHPPHAKAVQFERAKHNTAQTN